MGQWRDSGRSQAAHPTGSLGIAISEAVEVAAKDPDCNYSLGSVLNHVLLHQTVIGQEALLQMEPSPEQIVFDTVLEISSATFEVKGAGADA